MHDGHAAWYFSLIGYVMGPPLRPDTTTPAYLMDLLAKYASQGTALCIFSYGIFGDCINLITVFLINTFSLSLSQR